MQNTSVLLNIFIETLIEIFSRL